MGLPPGPRKNRYAPLQQSAAWILSYPLIQDTVLTLDLLEGPLNSLADVYDDVEYANVDAGMLARAFTDTDENAKLMEEERFLYSYDETFPDVKFDDSEKHMLYTHIRKEGEKEIGQFTKPQSGVLRLNSRMIKDAPRGEDKQILRDARIFRSEDRAFYNWIDDNVPVETKADIQNFLKAYKKEQVRMATVNANKKGAKEKGNAKNLKRKNDQRESRKMPSPMKAMASFRSGLASISRPTTPKRPGSRGSAKKKQKKVGVKEAVLDLHTEYLETKNLIRAGVGKLRDLKQKIDNEMDGLDADIVAEVEALIKSAEDMNLSEPATVDPSADPSAAPSADPSADPSAAPSNSTKPTVDTPLYLIYKGKVLKGSAMEEVLLFDEIEEMLDEVDPAVDNPRQEAIRNTRGYKKERYGASYCWVPEGATVISSSYFTKLKKAMALKKNLDDLLDGEQCTLSRDALIVLSAFGMHNYGGSDEAMEMAIAGAWSALFKEIGYEFESKALGKACPSQRTIGRYDLNLAADCLAWMVHQIEKDGAKEVGIVTDHGHRGGQDHFVIVVIWSGLDENNRPTFRYCCPSIDSAGHTADEAARGVKTVLDRTLPEDVEVFCAMADAGGGGSIDNEYKVLKSIGVMAEDSKEANCSIHGKQKSLENPSKATMGDQGMGSRTPFQMLWVFARLMSTIRKEGGIKLLDSLWSIVQHEMMDNLEWEDHAVEQMGMAWREWLTSVQNIDEEDPEQMEKFVKFITEAPRNIQDPVWTRWASVSLLVFTYLLLLLLFCRWVPQHLWSSSPRAVIVIGLLLFSLLVFSRCPGQSLCDLYRGCIRHCLIGTQYFYPYSHLSPLIAFTNNPLQIIKTNDIFLENYATIYFLAVAIKTHYPTKKYLCKVACTLISLMNERAEPPETFDTQSIESFIDSQNIEADVPSTCNTKSTPTFYTMLLFHKAFCDYAFNDNFAFLLRDDPYYGINTFGQGSRHMAVRCYVMRKQLDELKNGGWKEKDEFTKFKEALANIPKESKHDAKRAYFGRMVEKFFGIYEENLEKHLFDRWRNNKLISYMLGSEPVLAKEFANALCHYEEQYNAMAVDEEGNATNNVIEPYANFPDEMMILEEHHTIRKGKDVVINVKEAMEWLLKICDFSKILQEDRFVKNHMKEIRELAAAEGTVRLFDLKDNGESFILLSASLCLSSFLFRLLALVR